jgi:prepilin-type N-terminal cleavage/methylation domain-containing protein
MQSGQKGFSLMERLTVMAIILFVAAIAIQNLLHSVKASEERTLNAAIVEYSTLKSMYAEQHHTGYSGAATMNVTAADNFHNEPIN